MPSNAVAAVMPGSNPAPPDPAALQAELQRFADGYVNRTSAALDEFSRLAGTAEARSQALRWKVQLGSAAVGIASGPNPRASLLDFVVLATVNRIVVEEVWIPGTNGPAFQPWLPVSRSLETNAWMMTQDFLTVEQQAELRQSIQGWWDSNPDARSGFLVRPEEFSALIRQAREKDARPGSVFGLVGLDPTAGLDPAVREVTRTRMLAERALFTAQRAPFLLRWQIELLGEQLLKGPEVRTLVETSERLGRTAETATTAMAQWPDRLSAERKAIVTALDEQEGELRELSAEVGRTVAAGESMSRSLNTTLVTFDALMKRFGIGEPKVPSAVEASGGGGQPFRIQDYGETAERLESAAKQLTELIRTADQTLGSTNVTLLTARLSPVVEDAQTRGRELVNFAFWRGVILVGMVFLGALVYRFLAVRMTGAGTR